MASFIPTDLQKKIVDHSVVFLRWWLNELRGMCPAKLRERFAVGDAFYLIEVVDSQATVCYGTDYGAGHKVVIDLTLPDVEQQRLLDSVVTGEQKTAKKAKILIAEDKLLTRHVYLPLAVEFDLANVLNYELDRLTPYSLDNSCFAYTVEKRNIPAGKITVRLVLIEKGYLEQVVSRIENMHLTVASISPAADFDLDRQGHTSGVVNLLPQDRRPPDEALFNKTSRNMLLATVIMLLAVLILPVYYNQQRIEDVHSDINSVEKKARQIGEKRGELIKQLHVRDTLIERKNSEMAKVEVLYQLTAIVPDNTWITRLAVENGELKIDGESEQASTMIELLESQAAFKDTEFASPITKNTRTGKETFQIKARLVGKEKSPGEQTAESAATALAQ